MSDDSRIEDLKRRVEREPGSIAFAQLAEEYRRAGRFKESATICRIGLSTHPTFQSARITLGRALARLGEFDAAGREFEAVLGSDRHHLPALQGLADVVRHQGRLDQALAHYRAAQALAPNDPALERIIREIAEQIATASRRRAATTVDALGRWLSAIEVTRAERRA